MSLEQIYLKTLEVEGSLQGDDEPDELILSYLTWLDEATQKIGSLSELGMSPIESTSLYTRIANCIISWVVDHDTSPRLAVVEAFAARKTMIWAIFEASAYSGQTILSERAGSYTFSQSNEEISLVASSMSERKMLRLLTVVSINNANEQMIQTALSQDPDYAFALWLGWTAERIRVTDKAVSAESILLAFTADRDPIGLPPTLLEAATFAYMYFTYMVHEQKHDMKAYLNRCFGKTLDESRLTVPELPTERIPRAKPKMIIPLERFVSGHAMHRCYAEYIAWLRDEFETIALVNAKDIDEQSGAIFDRIIQKETNWNIQDVVNIVSMESPDIIYYPSIGMNTWVIMMSNIRLAPVQVMTFGHPATSTSPVIDYAYQAGSKYLEGAEAHCTEKLLFGPVIEASEPWSAFIPNVRATDLPVKAPFEKESATRTVAINAKIMKLNAVFLQMLKLIEEEQHKLGRDIKWQFYPAEKGFGFDGLGSFLRRDLKSVVVYQYQTYPEFLESLATSDLSLVPFPFGNTNSTVDAALLGVPVVFLHTSAPASVGDGLVLERLQCFESAAAHSIEEYFARAMEYLDGGEGYEGFAELLTQNCSLELMESGGSCVEEDVHTFVQSMSKLAYVTEI